MAQKLFRKTYHADTKAAQGSDRTLVVTISTINPDRSKDVVVPAGMEAENYLKNPVVAAFHRYDQPAIAKTIELQQLEDRIVAKLQFPRPGIYPLADQLYELYKDGIMNAWSIGFIPKERTDLDPDNWMGGYRFDKWELLEYSAVTVPDNPEALTMLRSKGFEIEDPAATPTVDEVEEGKEHAAAAIKELEENNQATKSANTTGEENVTVVIEASVQQELLAGIKALNERLDALEQKLAPQGEDETAEEEPDTTPESKSTDEPTPSDHHMVLPLVEALKLVDKTVGKALRNVNEQAKKDS